MLEHPSEMTASPPRHLRHDCTDSPSERPRSSWGRKDVELERGRDDVSWRNNGPVSEDKSAL